MARRQVKGRVACRQSWGREKKGGGELVEMLVMEGEKKTKNSSRRRPSRADIYE